jgi:peptidylprolyl isomerase
MAEIKDPENTILMQRRTGTVVIELMPEVAPKPVKRVKTLARAGTGGSDLPVEFSDVPDDRGTLGAARSPNPNSANSQFFINFRDNYVFNRPYTVCGRVIAGMEHADRIARGEPPANPDKRLGVRVAADV